MSKMPAKLRVTLKDWPEHPKGFANAYEPNTKAYAGREYTQNYWAYGDHFILNGLMWTKARTWVYDASNSPKSVTTERLVDQHLQPRIIDNLPVDGFQIVTSVTRSSTSNKLWQVLDPRGFILEISTDNLEDIINKGLINKGLIIGKCQWRTAKILERVL